MNSSSYWTYLVSQQSVSMLGDYQYHFDYIFIIIIIIIIIILFLD